MTRRSRVQAVETAPCRNRSKIFKFYHLVLLCVVHCVTGIAYALAIYFEPGQAQLWLVLLPVVFTLVASKDSVFMSIVGDYIYPKWALEAFIIANARRWCSPTSLNIPRAVWNPPLTRRGSPQPECAARVGVSESDTPQDI
ncbi:ABC transporter G family member 24 [Capsicum baccatum]|uniref:ABC transporter G family member 24 n=1 Tax=Capsicum baccatum TaxID=33114 RepID=A0A2G2VQ44_CAPBA|nr:ABC transporter G family member 24 [Capsicum baccatum]